MTRFTWTKVFEESGQIKNKTFSKARSLFSKNRPIGGGATELYYQLLCGNDDVWRCCLYYPACGSTRSGNECLHTCLGLATILLPKYVINNGWRVRFLICIIIWAMYTAKLLRKIKKKNSSEKRDTDKSSKQRPDEGRRLNRYHHWSDRRRQSLKRD